MNKMLRFIIAAFLTGFLFVVMNGLINGNPYAVKLLECFKPISRQNINVPIGVLVDLLYGFSISGLFIIILPVLPSTNGIVKGITFGVGLWFFKVVMGVISYWMMFNIPGETLIYLLFTGLIEMMILGVLNGLIIKK